MQEFPSSMMKSHHLLYVNGVQYKSGYMYNHDLPTCQSVSHFPANIYTHEIHAPKLVVNTMAQFLIEQWYPEASDQCVLSEFKSSLCLTSYWIL